MPDFIVLGLPRSGTTWLANWLTTERSLCLHDPFATRLPEDIEAERDGRALGIACTGAFLMPTWLRAQRARVAIVEREPAQCDESLARIGLPSAAPLLRDFAAAEGRRWRFDQLWLEDDARALWSYLLPDVPFDAARYALLREMRIEPRTYTADPVVLDELQRRGLFHVEQSQEASPCRGA